MILVIVTAVFLVQYQLRYARVKNDLSSTKSKLNALYARKPFPSSENVVVLKENLDTMQKQFSELMQVLEASNFEVTQMESAEFSEKFLAMRNRLHGLARKQNVIVPEGFSFGFDKYSGGNLPAAIHVDRLAVQMHIIERLCSLLYQNGISTLDKVQRQEFESARAVVEEEVDNRFRRRRPAPVSEAAAKNTDPYTDDQGILYGERLAFGFVAKEGRLWEIVNALAKSNLFIVITDLQVMNQKSSDSFMVDPKTLVKETKTAVAGMATTPLPLRRDERIIAGREDLRIALELEVFRFMPESTEEEDRP